MKNYAVQRCDWPVYRSSLFFFLDHRAEHAYENKTRSGFIDRQRKGASLAHWQRLEARIKVFSGSNDYRIRISSLRFFLLQEGIFFGEK